MSAPNDGGPAFPYGTRNVTERYSEGMTLRDYFAAAALQGILMNYTTEKFGVSEHDVAVCAYDYADAMLAERNKGGAS